MAHAPTLDSVLRRVDCDRWLDVCGCGASSYVVRGKTFADGAQEVQPIAAGDLRCAADAISFRRCPVPGGCAFYVADGCGQRATYYNGAYGGGDGYVLLSRFPVAQER